jgi:crotonobetainyl-CoA:carnitine CoA-transferase CaiB-like acyl-CoA transferase
MSDQPGASGPLAGLRVIDLATDRAELAGRLLADLGADVIKVEPPGGSPSRRLPPFERGREGEPNGSLYWAAVALNKQSVVLDLNSERDRGTLRQLIAAADIFIESFDPGFLGALSLGYEAMRALNPALVYVSVTPFGQDGPAAHVPATDLTIEAAGGLLGLQGDRDRPPVPVGYPQASFHAGVQAAADAIVALNERAVSGLGQHLDVSMQAAMVWTLMHATGFPPNTGGDPPGTGDDRDKTPPEPIPGVDAPPRIWEVKDGWVVAAMGLGALGARTLNIMSRWMEREGLIEPGLVGRDWSNWSIDVREGRMPPQDVNHLIRQVVQFFKTRTKLELFDLAIAESLLIAPIYTVEDIANDRQLKAREYWKAIAGMLYPGTGTHFSRTPMRYHAAAPAPGEQQQLLESLPVPAARPAPRTLRRSAFDGIRVADFAWVGAGPIVTKALADHGATVIHVETASRPDVLRAAPPYKDGVAGLDRAQFMANFNSSKLGISLDLTTKGGHEVARRLIAWSDVMVESFTPGTLAKYGLAWEDVSARRPDLIMMSSCLRGQTGPERTYGGFGGQGAALAGLHGITGWPDRGPDGPWGAYTDFIAPRYSLAALGSAIFERRKSGLGQYIDISQVECGIHFVEPLMLDYLVNGRVAKAAGHESDCASPHGVYTCSGHERYIAIAVETAAQWRALCSLAPLGAFGGPEFEALGRRMEADAEIDRVLCDWCRKHDAFELAAKLQAAGVPASVVQRPMDLYQDPQLAHRGFFITLDHTVMGPTPYDGLTTLFSETPGRLRKAAPCLGEDTLEVLTGYLGYSTEEVAELAAEGCLT